MPNWCCNTLKVSGNAKELKEFVFETQGLPASYQPQECEKGLERVIPTEKFFCFNALVPTPQAVLDMGYDASEKLPKNICFLIEQGNNIEEIDGYHWSIQNWGTKWDVYNNHITPKKMGWFDGCKSIHFSFDTAWSPPEEWFGKVVKMFPELKFELEYKESGMFFAGIMYGEDGELSVDEYDVDKCFEIFGQCYEGD